MDGNNWPEVTRALEEKKHELTLSDATVAERLTQNGLDMRIFQISTLNFLEISNTSLQNLPNEIGNLGSMKNLALQRNKIAEVPYSIGKLSQLKFLDMSFNDLTGFPSTLAGLRALHTLNLSCNNIEDLPNLAPLCGLVILHIEHNKLKSLPDGIYELKHLMKVHAANNEITEINQDINQIGTLTVLDVSNNKIKDLPNQLTDCPRLKDLNLSENPLNDNRLKKMTSQCNTKAIIDYIAAQSGSQARGKKGKKKKQGKGGAKDIGDEAAIRKIHIMRCPQDHDMHVTFTDAVKDVRPYIICTVIKDLDLSESQMFKKFISLQSKLHDSVCDSRTKATIATHKYSSLKFPLVYAAKCPSEITILPLGGNAEISADEYVKKLKDQKEAEEKKKKRQQSSGVYRFLDLLKEDSLYPCLLSENKVVSLPPVTNSDATKINSSICDIFIEVTSSLSLAACKEAMEKLIEQLFQLGYKSSPYTDSHGIEDRKELKGLVLQQVRVQLEDGQLRSIFPSSVDLEFQNIPVSFVE